MTKVIAFPDPISSMELSLPTQRLVLTSGKTVNFIPALPHTGHSTHTLTLRYAPSSASIHPIHQDRFVTGSMTDEWVRVHGINGEEVDVLKGHHGPVHCVEFSPDGEMYASGSGAFCFQSVNPKEMTRYLYIYFALTEDGKDGLLSHFRNCAHFFSQELSDSGRQHPERPMGCGKGLVQMGNRRMMIYEIYERLCLGYFVDRPPHIATRSISMMLSTNSSLPASYYRCMDIYISAGRGCQECTRAVHGPESRSRH